MPELVLWGCRRFPVSRPGIYTTGLVVTRTVEGARNLSELLRERQPPWVQDGRHCEREVLTELARTLVKVHGADLVHGDYMLKNFLYIPGDGERRIWMLDLASGWPVPPGEPIDKAARLNDLLRMVISIARDGLSLEDALFFLETYLIHREGEAEAHRKAAECLQACLALPDHRASEVAQLFGLQRDSAVRERR
jgi:tRNA A-37 threonylcarbamoyl transferase component Bud32